MNRFLKPSSAEPLAFFRIAIAILGLIQGLWLVFNISLLYGADGLVPWSLSKEIVSPYMPQLSWLQPLITTTGTNPDIWVYSLMGLYLLSLLGLLTGNYTRTSATIAWALQFMFINTGFMAAYGVETFMHIALFYCILMPVGSTFSIDAIVKPGSKNNEWNTLSIRVLQLHLCLVYIASGTEKAMGVQWWNGEAIWQTLMQGQFARFDMHWIAQYPWFAKCLGWSTLIIETCYPLYIFWSRSRPYGYLAVVLLHISIAIFMGLQLFSAIMIIFNTAAFGWPYVRSAYISLVTPLRERKRLRRAGMVATQAFWNME
ncbi:Vitamin K-dependent gamma-carboxylase [Chitinophaga sp. CF118]|uniref:HTTM domain-containing protein n=1 Tax=Chitinophaga sp. CF118 TaxID=1884367 RepID=UPI0008F1C097|nr:HTTM domain-containing protein [Chitinophaga sp. CF118]SFD20843.1 Vitamin K-dependent gamma-carboxylase [Chitinophaga sp. CF118]